MTYFTEPVPGSEPTYLAVRNPIDLSKALDPATYRRMVDAVSRETIIGKVTVNRILGGGELPAVLLLDGLRSLRLDRKALLSEIGFDAILSPVDRSIHPLRDDAEYCDRGIAKLSEHAEQSGYTRVWKVQDAIISATAATVATGALSSSATEQPPGNQDRVALSHLSTESIPSPAVTPRQSSPSTNLGSSTSIESTTGILPAQPRIGDRHYATGRNVYHEIDDLDQLMDEAKKHFPHAVDLVSKAVGMTPGAYFQPPGEGVRGMARVKSNAERIRQKLDAGRAPSNLSDIIGARIWVDNLNQAQSLVDRLSQLSGSPAVFDEDFTSGMGRHGYRARHVNVRIPGSRMSMEVQIVPREIGEIQEEAHGLYDKFREPTASLHEVIDAKAKSIQMFTDAFKRYVKRVTGYDDSPGASLFRSTPIEPQTAVASNGAPMTVQQDGDRFVESPVGKYLDITHPVDISDPVPDKLAADLKRTLGVEAQSVGQAYQMALHKLKMAGEANPRATLHDLFSVNGVDGIRYKADGGNAWLPMSDAQIYEPSTVKMSEWAAAQGYLAVDSNFVQLADVTPPKAGVAKSSTSLKSKKSGTVNPTPGNALGSGKTEKRALLEEPDYLSILDRAPSVKWGMEPDWETSGPRGELRTGKPGSFVRSENKGTIFGNAPIEKRRYTADDITAYDDSGEAVGHFSILKTGPNKNDIGAFKIVVRPDAQRKGWGQKLLDEAERQGIDVKGSISRNRFTESGRALLRRWLANKLGAKLSAPEPVPGILERMDIVSHIRSGKPWGIIQADNPHNEAKTPEWNAQAAEELRKHLASMGVKFFPMEGHTKDVPGVLEHPFFLPDVDSSVIRDLGKQFGQAMVIHSGGFEDLATGKINPIDPPNTRSAPDYLDAPYFSVYEGPEGRVAFEVPVDWDTVIGPGAKLSEPSNPDEEYEFEVDFAKKVLDGSKPIDEYPYFDSYRESLKTEATMVPESGGVLMVGAGPLPVSQILMASELGRPVDGLEIMPEAVELANQVLAKESVDGKVTEGDGASFDYSPYSAIHVALDVGQSPGQKLDVLKAIHSTMPDDGVVLIRTSKDPDGGFPSLGSAFEGLFDEVDRKPVFDGLSETVKLTKASS